MLSGLPCFADLRNKWHLVIDRLTVLFLKFLEYFHKLQVFMWWLLELHIIKVVSSYIIWVSVKEASDRAPPPPPRGFPKGQHSTGGWGGSGPTLWWTEVGRGEGEAAARSGWLGHTAEAVSAGGLLFCILAFSLGTAAFPGVTKV